MRRIDNARLPVAKNTRSAAKRQRNEEQLQEAMRPKREKTSYDPLQDDRISLLPLPILHDILKAVPAKDLAKMSMTSSNLRAFVTQELDKRIESGAKISAAQKLREPSEKAKALCAVGPAIQHMHIDDTADVVSEILTLPHAWLRSQTTKAMAAYWNDFTAAHAGELIDAIDEMWNAWSRADVVAGLAMKLEVLEASQRSALVDHAVDLRTARFRAKALMPLIEGIHLLSISDRDKIVDSIIHFPISSRRDEALHAQIIQAIGKQLNSISETQRSSIVNLLVDPNLVSECDDAGQQCILRMLTGLFHKIDTLNTADQEHIMAVGAALGGNATTNEYRRQAMSAAAKALSDIDTSLHDRYIEWIFEAPEGDHVVTAIQDLAKQFQVLFIDAHTRLAQRISNLPDSLHKKQAIAQVVAHFPGLSPSARKIIVRNIVHFVRGQDRDELMQACLKSLCEIPELEAALLRKTLLANA